MSVLIKNKKHASQKLHSNSQDFGCYWDFIFDFFFLEFEYVLAFHCSRIKKKKKLKVKKKNLDF